MRWVLEHYAGLLLVPSVFDRNKVIGRESTVSTCYRLYGTGIRSFIISNPVAAWDPGHGGLAGTFVKHAP